MEHLRIDPVVHPCDRDPGKCVLEIALVVLRDHQHADDVRCVRQRRPESARGPRRVAEAAIRVLMEDDLSHARRETGSAEVQRLRWNEYISHAKAQRRIHHRGRVLEPAAAEPFPPVDHRRPDAGGVQQIDRPVDGSDAPARAREIWSDEVDHRRSLDERTPRAVRSSSPYTAAATARRYASPWRRSGST